MSLPVSPSPVLPKSRRVRVYTRLNHAIRTRLLAYCAATGRSERAVIEDAVDRYLEDPGKGASTSGPLDRLAQAIDEDQRLRERQHRELELLSETFGRFLRLWLIVHAPTITQPPTREGDEALSRQRATGESLYKRLVATVAEQFRRGHRFVMTCPTWTTAGRSTAQDREGPPLGAARHAPGRVDSISSSHKSIARRAALTVTRCLPAAFAILETFPPKRM